MDPAARAELLAVKEQQRALAARIEALERVLGAVPANDAEPEPADRPSLELAFVNYVSACIAANTRPSRKANLAAMRQAGHRCNTRQIRALRRLFAPAAWHVPGKQGAEFAE